jgi:hypothetical protein
MTRRRVSDEQFGKVAKRAWEVVRRVDKFNIPVEYALNQLQKIIEHRIFTFPVDFDDPRWRDYPGPAGYTFVSSKLTSEDFPVPFSGRAEVTVEVAPYFDGKTYQEYLSICAELGTYAINRPVAETFGRLFGEVVGERCFAPCSQLMIDQRVNIAFVGINHSGTGFGCRGICLFDFLEEHFSLLGSKVLMIREVKPLPSV